MARRIVDPLSKVAFAMSCLDGRARSWAYERRLADPTCFSTYDSFKRALKLAFEPLKNEFRSRDEFLDLQQGTPDVHAYAQRARYLVSNVVTKPIDETTKVVTFMKELKDGPVKTYLFREYPSTLEAAITLAIQEEFSLRQAKLHVDVLLPPEPAVDVADEVEGPEPIRGQEPTCNASGAETSDIMHANVRHQYNRSLVDVAIQGVVTGLADTCPRVQEPAGDRPQTEMSAGGINEHGSVAEPGRNAYESGIDKKKRRRKHKTLHGMSAGQAQEPTVAVETLNVLTPACAGYQ
ncbi:hypothetical protein PHMEG_00028030 [Phytophthora megakarya]|uniref:Retrotransposon gag domain-containing protein n=1 Tax=Phytophthora megakarya TaxID=4795 RepID=A0A225V5I2_9STRA|nr:hypothetical protein PHMEG_00028030 [Phytophthora megakarya]